ncbi:hypothetical protein B0T21DRAFT_349300 [Apiosordaria backusii]|uniref:Uncharacterized protein n=1 Tax=Apiosordaria backusii TaxID=314023 RepID=A0AA40EBY3_9PEZI|nr:hypothetical protein B0T21DRAFT_349300 [Apiosordaria backusii]
MRACPREANRAETLGSPGYVLLARIQLSGTGRLLAVSLPSGIHPLGKLLPTRHLCANQTNGSGLDLKTDFAMGSRHSRWVERGSSSAFGRLCGIVSATSVQDQRRPTASSDIMFPQPATPTPCDAQESRSIEMTALASPMDELEIGCNRGSGPGCGLSVSFSDIGSATFAPIPSAGSEFHQFMIRGYPGCDKREQKRPQKQRQPPWVCRGVTIPYRSWPTLTPNDLCGISGSGVLLGIAAGVELHVKDEVIVYTLLLFPDQTKSGSVGRVVTGVYLWAGRTPLRISGFMACASVPLPTHRGPRGRPPRRLHQFLDTSKRSLCEVVFWSCLNRWRSLLKPLDRAPPGEPNVEHDWVWLERNRLCWGQRKKRNKRLHESLGLSAPCSQPAGLPFVQHDRSTPPLSATCPDLTGLGGSLFRCGVTTCSMLGSVASADVGSCRLWVDEKVRLWAVASAGYQVGKGTITNITVGSFQGLVYFLKALAVKGGRDFFHLEQDFQTGFETIKKKLPT